MDCVSHPYDSGYRTFDNKMNNSNLPSRIELLSSFAKWKSSVPVSILVENGFKYTGNGDVIQCVNCGFKLSGLKSNDNTYSISMRHKTNSPECIYVKNMSENTPVLRTSREFCEHSTTPPLNISQKTPLGNSNDINKPLITNGSSNDPLTSKPDVVPSHYKKNKSTLVPTSSEFPLPVPVKFAADGSYKVSSSGSRSVVSDSDNGSNPEPIAKIAEYQDENSRLASYGSWPDDAPVKPPVLARAGLFYTGVNDKVKCPFCLGSMYNWEVGDLPLNEHAKHYPECRFVKYKIHQNLNPSNTGMNPSAQPLSNGVLSSTNQGTVRSALSNNLQSDTASPIPITSDKQSDPAILKNVKFEDIPAVKIVGDMGYSLRMIRIAVRKIKDYSPLTLTTGMLLDVIFKMEEDGYTSDANDDGFCEGSHGDETQGAMAAEPSTNPKFATDKLNHEDQTSDYGTVDSSEVGQLVDFDPKGKHKSNIIEKSIPELSLSDEKISSSAEKKQPKSTKDSGSSEEVRPKSPKDSGSSEEVRPKSPKNSSSSEKVQPKSPKGSDAKSNKEKDGSNKKSEKKDATKQSKKVSVKDNPQYRKLAEEHEKYKKNKICNVCGELPVSVLFLPCRHLICCESCANESKFCPQCKKLIVGTVKIFLS